MKLTSPLIPVGPNVLVKKSASDQMSAGGLHIPESAQKPINKGTVVSVGRGTFTRAGVSIPCECQPGDTVWWSKYQGTEVDLEGEKFWLVREDDVVARVTEKA